MKIKIDTQLILDLCITGFFTLSCLMIMKFVIPEGNTTFFLLRASKLVTLVIIALSILFLIFWCFNRNFNFKKKVNIPKLKDLLLLALPMSPVIDYALINSEYLTPNSFLYLIGITLAFTFFFSFIFPIVFSYFASLKILMISGLALSFTIMSLAKINNNPDDHILGSMFITQGIYLIVSFTVVYLLYLIDKKTTYIFLIFFMISGIVINFLNYSSSNSNKFDNSVTIKKNDRLDEFLNDNNNMITKKKNIYLLVYESYAGLETLRHYGLDNTEQMKFLEKNGFKVYHGIYSSGGSSLPSTSRILEMDGELSKPDRHYTSGNAFGLDIFKANGYKTIGIFNSPFFFGTSPIIWDEYYPKERVTKMGGKALTKSIFESQFKFNIFEDGYNYKNYLQIKKKYLNLSKKNTLFYTHNKYPGHSGNTGKCASDEKKLYFERIKKGNTEMKNDVSNILNNDPDSIIVLLSDHGPYLTKNCRTLENYDISSIDKYDIQDRYGTFLSIYWPNDISDVENNIVITQDIFPAILSRITNNKNLFKELKIESKIFDENVNWNIKGINVYDGIIRGGKDNDKPLFDEKSYNLPN